METVSQIAKGATRFFSGTLMSRVAGMIRDVSMAAIFGSHPAVAAFLMAFRFVNLPRRVLGEGAMQSAFVPLYEEIRGKDSAAGEAFARSLLRMMTVGLSGLILLCGAVLYLCYPHLSAGAQEVVGLTGLMLPALLFAALYGVNLAYLSCHKIFFLPSVAPTFFNLTWIGGVIVLGLIHRVEVGLLAGVVVGALALQWAVTYRPVRSRMRGGRLMWWSPDLSRLAKRLGLTLLGVGATQINSALDPIFARLADPSGPAYLWYAIRLQQLPLALVGISLSAALLPTLSRGGDWGRSLAFAYRSAVRWMVPATLGALTTGIAAVTLIYGRGRFSSHAVVETTQCLWAYGLALLPMTWVLVQTAACHSKGSYRLPATISALVVALNITLNGLFVFGFGWGSFSVALATALSSWVQALLLFVVLKKRGWEAEKWLEIRSFLLALAAAGLSYGVAHLLQLDGIERHFASQLLHFGVVAVPYVICLPLFDANKKEATAEP